MNEQIQKAIEALREKAAFENKMADALNDRDFMVSSYFQRGVAAGLSEEIKVLEEMIQ